MDLPDHAPPACVSGERTLALECRLAKKRIEVLSVGDPNQALERVEELPLAFLLITLVKREAPVKKSDFVRAFLVELDLSSKDLVELVNSVNPVRLLVLEYLSSLD